MINQCILVTGASGFLGNHILSSCRGKGVELFTLGRTKVDNVKIHTFWDAGGDIIPKLEDLDYSQVIHVTGKAHTVPKTEEEEINFYNVNFKGTIRLLDALSRLTVKPKQFVFISSIAIYGLDEGELITEDSNPKPKTPYGKSKWMAEKYILDWGVKNNIKCLILRLPLIVGKNPPGNLGAMKKAITKARYPKIGRNNARKSVVLASDVAKLIANIPTVSGVFNLTDGDHPSFAQIESAIEKRTKRKINIVIPVWVAKSLGFIGDVLIKLFGKNFPISSDRIQKILSTLTFDDTKARKELSWNPNPVLPFIEKEL